MGPNDSEGYQRPLGRLVALAVYYNLTIHDDQPAILSYADQGRLRSQWGPRSGRGEAGHSR